jgi:hypothetical protein
MAYLDAVRDADHYSAQMNAALDRRIATEKQLTRQITELITITVRKLPAKAISLPYAAPSGICAHTLPEVVRDECGVEGKPLDALMRVMESSNCPLVAEWREAIAASYCGGNVDNLAELMT